MVKTTAEKPASIQVNSSMMNFLKQCQQFWKGSANKRHANPNFFKKVLFHQNLAFTTDGACVWIWESRSILPSLIIDIEQVKTMISLGLQTWQVVEEASEEGVDDKTNTLLISQNEYSEPVSLLVETPHPIWIDNTFQTTKDYASINKVEEKNFVWVTTINAIEHPLLQNPKVSKKLLEDQIIVYEPFGLVMAYEVGCSNHVQIRNIRSLLKEFVKEHKDLINTQNITVVQHAWRIFVLKNIFKNIASQGRISSNFSLNLASLQEQDLIAFAESLDFRDVVSCNALVENYLVENKCLKELLDRQSQVLAFHTPPIQEAFAIKALYYQTLIENKKEIQVFKKKGKSEFLFKNETIEQIALCMSYSIE